MSTKWNETATSRPNDRCIHQLFEAQVQCAPYAVAVICGDQQLTYRELDRRANQLAHYLQRFGVGPDVLVGICIERSLEMMVGLLAILKAGGAYVPLDPTYPKKRLAFMLADAQVSVLVTQDRLVGGLPAYPGRIIRLDTDWPLIAQEPQENPVSSVTADNLAYVIYTSGSTGEPKGVAAIHRGPVNRFAWMWRAYPFESGEITCQKTPLGFVDSVWEAFTPLLRGIPAVIIPDEVVKDPRRLIETLTAYGVTRIILVPSLLKVIVDTCPDLESQLPRLKHWTTSGEALSVQLCQRFLGCMPHALLINMYGSSESSGHATSYNVDLARLSVGVPIGRPIANTQVYILDSQLDPVPIGVTGELYIGGDGLARGYLNRPELTAEKFIRNPFSDTPRARLYKSGDLARYRSDGNIEFLGRLDDQVKIRGFRIELGEIEAALSQHPAVRKLVVLAREDIPGANRVVVYLVVDGEARPTINEFRRYLSERLPEYMVPAVFVFMDVLPLTPNGKVDRRALPAPGAVGDGRRRASTAPLGPVEDLLANIWADVLRLEQVGVDDQFLEVGGDSLSATRVVARLRQALSLDVAISDFFTTPTVAEMALVLTQRLAAQLEPGALAQLAAELDEGASSSSAAQLERPS